MRRFLSLAKKEMKVFYLAFNFLMSIVAIYLFIAISFSGAFNFGNYSEEYKQFLYRLLDGYFLKAAIPILIFNFILAVLINKNFKYFILGMIIFYLPIVIYIKVEL